MISLLVTFILSGILITLMLTLKQAGYSGVSVPFWESIRMHSDPAIAHDVAAIRKFFVKFNRAHFYALLYRTLKNIRARLKHLERWLDVKLHRLKNLVRGKRDLSSRGQASSFLHNIKESRDEERGI